MATEYEYEYEYDYECPPKIKQKTVELPTEDEIAGPEGIDNARFPRIQPDEIVLFLELKQDELGQKHYSGRVRSQGYEYFLDAYPHTADYKFTAPGGETKHLILRTLDEIRTEGMLARDERLQRACAGRLGDSLNRARNIGFIWIPGDRRQQHRIWWFVAGQDPQEFKLNKFANQLKWSKWK